MDASVAATKSKMGPSLPVSLSNLISRADQDAISCVLSSTAWRMLARSVVVIVAVMGVIGAGARPGPRSSAGQPCGNRFVRRDYSDGASDGAERGVKTARTNVSMTRE